MIIKLNINLSKLDKTAFHKGKNGTYCDLAVFVNDDGQQDQYGNDASVKQDLGKDRRDEKLYVGNGKIVSGGPLKRQEPQRRQSTPGKVTPDDGGNDPCPF